MRRGKRPNYWRFLLPAMYAAPVVAFMFFAARISQVACSFVPKQVVCAPMFPDWIFTAACAGVFGLFLWSAWEFYADHIRGQYQLDLMRWMDGSPYDE